MNFVQLFGKTDVGYDWHIVHVKNVVAAGYCIDQRYRVTKGCH